MRATSRSEVIQQKILGVTSHTQYGKYGKRGKPCVAQRGGRRANAAVTRLFVIVVVVVLQNMVRREEAHCESQSVVKSVASHDMTDYELYGIRDGMPHYMRRAFFTRVLLPQQAAEAAATALNYTLDDHERICVKSIIASFHDYNTHRYTSGVGDGYNNYEILDVSADYERSGYLTFSRAYDIIENYSRYSPLVTSSMILSLLSAVPDSSMHKADNYFKLTLLRLVLSKYRQECKMYPPDSIVYPPTRCRNFYEDYEYQESHKRIALTDFTRRKVGRLWLLLDVQSFYDTLLDDIASLPHLTLWDTAVTASSVGRDYDVPRYLRDHTTWSMLLVLLARISNDILERSFHENVVERDTAGVMFQFTMSHGYTALALVFSLFVDRARVRNCCSLVNRYRDVVHTSNNTTAQAALFYMLQLRDLPFEPLFHESHWDHMKRLMLKPIFDQSLATRALGCILRHDGLSAVLRLQQHVNLPPSIKKAIHRYFYIVVWNFLNVYVEKFRYEYMHKIKVQ